MMFKNVLTRFRNKKPTEISVDREILLYIYKMLYDMRLDLVECFYNIKNRRLRELYDGFALMMIKLDKTIQFLRRVLNEDLYAKYDKLSSNEINEIMTKLPVEVSISLRSLVQNIKLLKEFSVIAASPYINTIIKSINEIIDDIAKYLDRVVH